MTPAADTQMLLVSVGKIAPPIIFIAIAMLLTHFLNDADRHRYLCEKLRAKYILSSVGPTTYVNKSTNDKDKYEIYEDFLIFRAIKIHYGVISSITTLGLALSALIILHSIISCIEDGKYAMGFFFVFIDLFIIIVFCSYMLQQLGTARRLHELTTIPLNSDGQSFEQQGYKLLGAHVRRPTDSMYRFSCWLVEKCCIFSNWLLNTGD